MQGGRPPHLPAGRGNSEQNSRQSTDTRQQGAQKAAGAPPLGEFPVGSRHQQSASVTESLHARYLREFHSQGVKAVQVYEKDASATTEHKRQVVSRSHRAHTLVFSALNLMAKSWEYIHAFAGFSTDGGSRSHDQKCKKLYTYL